MNSANTSSNYTAALRAYEVSVNTFLGGRKKIGTLFLLGIAVSLALFITFFVWPPNRQGNSIQDLRNGMDLFIVICLCAAGAVMLGSQARTLPRITDLLVRTTPLSETEYEHALGEVTKKIQEGGEAINWQKTLGRWSLGLFLISDVLFVALIISWAN